MTREYDKLEDVRELIEDCIENLAWAQGVHRDLTGQQWIPPLRLAPRKRRESFEDSILREEARAMPYARNCEAELMARIKGGVAETPEPSIRERIGRIQTEIEAVDGQCGDAPDAFMDCVACISRDCEEMLLQIEEYEEREGAA